jgi:ABC-type Fe3+/spermidine/putrescine transport system ATPase subunit
MLKIENLTKSYGNNHILNDLNIHIDKGAVVQVSGASGAGKTTLLRCITGLETFESGSIKLNDHIIQSETAYVQPHKRKIGMVFQDLALWPHMTVAQNIDFVSSSIFDHKKEREQWNQEILQSFKIGQKENKYPSELSGGEQQRVAIARALANKPQLLLLDEPFSQLDKVLMKEIIFELETYIKNEEITLISVTHNPFEFTSIEQKFQILDLGIIQ